MKFNIKEGWIPFIIIVYSGDEIIGVVPLKTRKILGLIVSEFIFEDWCSPDFIIKDNYRELCINYVIDYLFNKLNFKFLFLSLESDSNNIYHIIHKYKGKNLGISVIENSFRHNILFVNSTWEDFCTLRGGNYKHKFKKMEKKINKRGPWKIIKIDIKKLNKYTVDKIVAIEKMSWKERERLEERKKDESLIILLDALDNFSEIEPIFKRKIWFLELNGQYIAYCLEFIFNDISFLVKTSYNNNFRDLYPGIFLMNKIIKNNFDEKEVTKIDFITSLDFMKTWSSTYLSRSSFIIVKGYFPNIIRLIITKSPFIKPVTDFFKHVLLKRYRSRTRIRL
jgi:hypothetical protein